MYGDSPVNRGIPLTDAMCKRAILYSRQRITLISIQNKSGIFPAALSTSFSSWPSMFQYIFAWCTVLIENIKIDRNCRVFIMKS